MKGIKPCKYKLYGDLKTTKHCPVVELHGGPGMSHHYMLYVNGHFIIYNRILYRPNKFFMRRLGKGLIFLYPVLVGRVSS